MIAARAVGNSALCALAACLFFAEAAAMPAAEEQKAHALLARVESAKGAVFIRNGSEYTGASAAEFLRRKCVKDWGRIASAREFIASCASQSSTSGKPYLIRLEGAAPQPSAWVLGQWLEEIEHAGK